MRHDESKKMPPETLAELKERLEKMREVLTDKNEHVINLKRKIKRIENE